MEMYKTPHMHVKKTLPPTLVGFPGEAEIRYYVKATVNRPSLFKENARAYVPFNFCPIEPPRPPPSEALGYARRRHQFNAALPTTPTAAPSKSKMASFFGGSKKAGATSSGATTPTAPFVAVDLRLPEPAILTCAKPVPARVVVTSLNGTTTGMTIVSLQLEVVSITKVRAQDVGRVERGSTVLFSRSGMSVPLQFGDGAAKDASATQAKETEPEAEVDSRLWTDQPLPNVVPPSFETCNITRTYEIFARIGIRYDVAGSMVSFKISFSKATAPTNTSVAPNNDHRPPSPSPNILRHHTTPRTPRRHGTRPSPKRWRCSTAHSAPTRSQWRTPLALPQAFGSGSHGCTTATTTRGFGRRTTVRGRAAELRGCRGRRRAAHGRYPESGLCASCRGRGSIVGFWQG